MAENQVVSRVSLLRDARRRLRLYVAIFCLALAVPLGLVIEHILAELRRETLHQYEVAAADLVLRINERIEKIFRSEERRPPEDYSFISLRSVAERAAKAPEYSPLAKIPAETVVPGVVGFFQVFPDGAFSTPILPDMDSGSAGELAKLMDAFDLRMREELKEELWQILKGALDLSASGLPEEMHGASNDDVEMDRFALRFLEGSKLLFTRRVWRAGRRFLQGFVVSKDPFFLNLAVPEISKSALTNTAEVRILLGEQVLLYFRPDGSGQFHSVPASTGLTLYQGRLAAPLEAVSMQIQVQQVPVGKGARGVYTLLGLLGFVLVVGVAGLYLLSSHNIELAQQQGNFLSAVSHELKTPLASIRMYAEMLRSGWVGDEAKRGTYHERILQESERLSRLIQNVLYLAKLSRAQMDLQREGWKVEALMTRVGEVVRPYVEQCGFTLLQDSAEAKIAGEIEVHVDGDAFTQLFVNLVENAVKFSKEAERKEVQLGVRVSSDHKRERLLFYVRDFGPGIDEREKFKIFSLFYRGESELTRRTPGTGIGLAIVAELAHQMGARVGVTNCRPGAEFWVEFEEAEAIDRVP